MLPTIDRARRSKRAPGGALFQMAWDRLGEVAELEVKDFLGVGKVHGRGCPGGRWEQTGPPQSFGGSARAQVRATYRSYHSEIHRPIRLPVTAEDT